MKKLIILTKQPRNYFASSRNTSEVIKEISKNNLFYKRVSFVNLTYPQLLALEDAMRSNSRVVHISIPSRANPEIYGPEHMTTIKSAVNYIYEKAMTNSQQRHVSFFIDYDKTHP